MKACTVCLIIKEFKDFTTHAFFVDGYLHKCKQCNNAYERARRAQRSPAEYKRTNARISEIRKSYKDFTPEQQLRAREKSKKWARNNTETCRKYRLANKVAHNRYTKVWRIKNKKRIQHWQQQYWYKQIYGEFYEHAILTNKLQKELKNAKAKE